MEEEIKRSDIDDPGRRNNNKDSYKNRVFNGARTTQDEYTGQNVYYSKNSANSDALDKRTVRYFTAEKTANVDHIVSLKRVNEKYQGKLSTEDMKELANRDYNLAVTNETLNKSKGDLSNHEYLYRQLMDGKPENAITTFNMLKQEISAESGLYVDKTVIRTIDKVGNTLKVNSTKLEQAKHSIGTISGGTVEAGTGAAMMAFTVSGINNFIALARGDKELQEAVVEVAKDSAASFGSSSGLHLAQKAVDNVAAKSGVKALAKLAKMPVVQIATTTAMMGRSILKYINDEISGEDCAVEMLMGGVGLLAFNMGLTLGGPGGAVIATLVTSTICSVINEYRSITKLSQEKLSKIDSLASAALREMENQRNELKAMVTEHFKEWDEKVNQGFAQMISSALDNNADGIANGLDSILSVVGQGVKFKSAEEFDYFFMDENAVLSF